MIASTMAATTLRRSAACSARSPSAAAARHRPRVDLPRDDASSAHALSLTTSPPLAPSRNTTQHNRKYYADIEAQLKVSTQSSTVYVGNLAFSTAPELIHSHFAMAGPVSKVIMGINRNTRSPCGFCFVVYEDVRSAREAVTMLSATKVSKAGTQRINPAKLCCRR